MNIFIHCRPGFERDAAEEVEMHLAEQGVKFTTRAESKSAFAAIETSSDRFELNHSELIFARQLLMCAKPCIDLPEKDKVTPILNRLQKLPDTLIPDKLYADLVIEPTDSNSGEELQRFCKKFVRPIENGLKKLGYKKVYSRKNLPRINIVFTDYSPSLCWSRRT